MYTGRFRDTAGLCSDSTEANAGHYGSRMENQASNDETFLRHIYERFNARDMETVLAAMHEEVQWANGMDGGYVYGRDGVCAYWTRQWPLVDPHVEPMAFSRAEDGAVVVEVHQTVRDLSGNLILDRMVGHIFHLEKERIRRFEIRGA